MPTCGKCGKPVADSDVTCPHCDALLAAYASPLGSGAATTYEAPPAPPSADIPDVDMAVKPPSEAEIVTDPSEVAEEPISTAPRPLFDTYLTVEEIAAAAESDHEDAVVTISEKKIVTKTVEFDVPDYARPPSNAAPIPTIDEDDASIPLITHDSAQEQHHPTRVPSSAPSSTRSAARKRPEIIAHSEDEGDSEPEPESDSASESWLYSSAPPAEPRTRPRRQVAQPSRPQTTQRAETVYGRDVDVGETDAYLRKLHQQAGYTPAEATISAPVEQRRIPPSERNRNRRSALSVQQAEQATASAQSTKMGCSALYVLLLALLWFSTIVMVMSGSFNTFLLFLTIAATWGFGPVRKFIDEIRNS